VGTADRTRSRRYVSAGELADYAYCPRSHYYRTHPDGRAPAEGALARERAGTSYHTRTIRSDRRRAESSPWPWVAALAVGAVLLAVAVLRWPL
jgi:hypothetical protein